VHFGLQEFEFIFVLLCLVVLACFCFGQSVAEVFDYDVLFDVESAFVFEFVAFG
jgi:hypothetical protein